MLRPFLLTLGIALTLGTAAAQDVPEGRANFPVTKCVNMGNALDAPNEGDWSHIIDTGNFATIRAAGIDSVRIPVRWSAHTGEGPGFPIDPAFLTRVDEVVDAALAADLNVILDVHHYDEIMQDPEAELPKLLNIWQQLGIHYADRPDTLSFEVLNEPHTNMKGAIMRRTQALAVSVLRKTNPTRTLIVGGEEWSSVRSLTTNYDFSDDRNVIYTFHYYDPFDFTHQKASWLGDAMPKGTRGWGSRSDRKQLNADFASVKAMSDALNQPIFLGEFGANEAIKLRDRLAYTKAVRETAEANGIGWCVWSFAVTFPVYDKETETWIEGFPDALGLDLD